MPPSSAQVYDYVVISRTGAKDASENTILGYNDESVSINDYGKVAFSAANNLGQSVYLGDVRGGVKVAENRRFEIPFSCSKKAPHGR